MAYGMVVDQERNKIWSLAWRGDTHTFKPSTQWTQGVLGEGMGYGMGVDQERKKSGV